LEYLYFEQSKNPDILKFVPTILQIMYEADTINEQFLVEWMQGRDVDDKLKEHPLYNAERDEKFKEVAKPFLDWLAAEEEDDEK